MTSYALLRLVDKHGSDFSALDRAALVRSRQYFGQNDHCVLPLDTFLKSIKAQIECLAV